MDDDGGVLRDSFQRWADEVDDDGDENPKSMRR